MFQVIHMSIPPSPATIQIDSIKRQNGQSNQCPWAESGAGGVLQVEKLEQKLPPPSNRQTGMTENITFVKTTYAMPLNDGIHEALF